jgi:hypothetical protein
MLSARRVVFDIKKLVLIIMAIIVLFSASVDTGVITASAKTPATITASVKAKARKKKKHKHKHNVPKGNIGKWFKSRKALKKHVDKVMKYWADKEERGEISREEYYKKCPCGYEAWSCSCERWTGNFKYD